MPETPTKSEVPLTESNPLMNDGSSQSDGSTVSIEPGSSVPSNGKSFAPDTTTASKGDTVTWINEDTTLHTVTSGTPDEGNSGSEFDSSYLAQVRSLNTLSIPQGPLITTALCIRS